MIYYGIHPVLESLKSHHPPRKIYLEQKKEHPKLSYMAKIAMQKGIPIERRQSLGEICATNDHQGVCASIDDFSANSLSFSESLGNRMVMLDGIQDPHNFGAVLRVCEVFGFKDIIFHKGNSCGVTAAAIKVSSGAIFHLNLYVSNLNAAVKKLKQHDYQIYVLDPEGDQYLPTINSSPNFCLVIGSEHKGVRFSIKRLADKMVTIPVLGKIQSLNVSCALTAALYALSNKR